MVRPPIIKSILLTVCSFFALLAVVSGQVLVGTEQQVTTAAADQFDPVISGNIIVYTDFSGVDADVWYTDLSTGLAHAISTAPGDQQLTGVSGNLVVFTDWNTMDVLVFHIDTGVTENLTLSAGANSLDPSIGGTLVAWTDDRDWTNERRIGSEIYARDLSTGEERRITDDTLVDQSPSVGDGLIVWEKCDGYACDVFVYDWATAITRQLTATPYASERFPDVSGRIVVFQREQGTPIDKDLVAVNLDTPGERVLAQAGDQENARISGDYVSCNDSSTGIPHIGLWQLSTGSYFQAVGAGSGQYLNDIDGNRIVYSDNRAGTLDIWMFTFHVEEPSGDLEPPVISGAADITVDATSAQGAIVVLPVTASDAVDPAPVLACAPASGTMFPITTTTVTCTATDASGNAATASFSVTVRGADAQLGSLAELVESLNLKHGIENSLDAKLSAATAALNAARAGARGTACSLLGAFANEVKAQTGKAITPADAAALLGAAARIGAVLGCGTP